MPTRRRNCPRFLVLPFKEIIVAGDDPNSFVFCSNATKCGRRHHESRQQSPTDQELWFGRVEVVPTNTRASSALIRLHGAGEVHPRRLTRHPSDSPICDPTTLLQYARQRRTDGEVRPAQLRSASAHATPPTGRTANDRASGLHTRAYQLSTSEAHRRRTPQVATVPDDGRSTPVNNRRRHSSRARYR